ncbi:major facilitator superfamily domain-containing protein [Jimgerdemannia flammicorona]|uniref:Major facilitator superfamily domain-containing protein n=1 Tax=Jimgerdemannia flammicorona TaxID=994334 RepID=A0A433D513_9FUNG|nr:major facilitator superfamily domain-containing protein [Jimgerdemannia flammicorona]
MNQTELLSESTGTLTNVNGNAIVGKTEYDSEVISKTDEEKAVGGGEDLPRIQLSPTSTIMLFIGLVLAVFLGSLDGTIVSTCLPVIASQFNAFDSITWVAVSYLLTFNALQPLYGKFSDIFGRKCHNQLSPFHFNHTDTMLFAILAFLIGSAGCGAATGTMMLIGFRALAGVGGAGLFGLTFIIIADIFPLEERPRYQAIVGSAFAFSSVFGPLLGGGECRKPRMGIFVPTFAWDSVFTEKVSWRWVPILITVTFTFHLAFYINLPIGAVTIVAIVMFLNLPYDRSSLGEKLKRVDFLGTIVLVGAIVCILLPTTWGGVTYPWSDPIVISLYVVAVVLIALFGIVEWKFAREPLMPLRMFTNRTIVAVILTQFFSGMAFFGYIFYMPIFFQVVRGNTPTTAGLQLLPMMLGLVVIGNIAGNFMNMIQKRMPNIAAHVLYIYVGNCLFLVGAGLTSTLDENTSTGVTVVYLLLVGIGLGLTLQMNLYAAQSAADPQDMAIATSTASFFQSIGGSIGIAIFGALEQNSLSTNLSKIPPSVVSPEMLLEVVKSSAVIYDKLGPEARAAVIHAYVEALHIIFTTAIPFVAIALFFSLFISRKRSQNEGEMVAHAAL